MFGKNSNSIVQGNAHKGGGIKEENKSFMFYGEIKVSPYLWALCAVPNASLMYTSPSFASESRKACTAGGSGLT